VPLQPTMVFLINIGAIKYFSSPSGSVMRIGTISPASLPSFFEEEADGIGNTCVSAWTELMCIGTIPTSRHTRKTAMPRRVVMSGRLEDVTEI
jgi:hypothetical protein